MILLMHCREISGQHH